MAAQHEHASKRQKTTAESSEYVSRIIEKIGAINTTVPPLTDHFGGADPAHQVAATIRDGLDDMFVLRPKLKTITALDSHGSATATTSVDPSASHQPDFSSLDDDEVHGVRREDLPKLYQQTRFGNDYVPVKCVDEHGNQYTESFKLTEYLGDEWKQKIHALDAVSDQSISTADLAVTPHAWQLKGAAQGDFLCKSDFRGIIIGDEMGLGKTLQAIMIGQQALQEHGSFNLVVCPAHLCRQWQKQISLSYKAEHQPRVCVVSSASIGPQELNALRPDWVITSYELLEYSYRVLGQFVEEVELWRRGRRQKRPKLPKAPFHSEYWRRLGLPIKRLILDECQKISKHDGKRLFACQKLYYRAAVLMSGTILSNAWHDIWGPLSMLRGHPFGSFDVFMNRFRTKSASGRLLSPNARQIALLQTLLQAFTIARPALLLQLPGLEQHVVWCKLSNKDAVKVARLFDQWQQATRKLAHIREALGQPALKGAGDIEGPDSLQPLKYLIRAQLVSLDRRLEQSARRSMEAEKLLLDHIADVSEDDSEDESGDEDEDQRARSRHLEDDMPRQLNNTEFHDDAEANDILCVEGEGRDAYLRRLDTMSDHSLASARSDAFVELLGWVLQEHTGQKTIVFSKYLKFLDVLAARTRKHFANIEVFRFDGSIPVARREIVVHDFKQASPGAVIFITGDAGGTGLNLQEASVVIQTEVWWNANTQNQALARALRQGATTVVHRYLLFAGNSFIDHFVQRVQNKKRKTNDSILDGIVRSWNEPAKIPMIYETELDVLPIDEMAKMGLVD